MTDDDPEPQEPLAQRIRGVAGELPVPLREEVDRLAWTELAELIREGIAPRTIRWALDRLPPREQDRLEGAVGKVLFNRHPETLHEASPWGIVSSGRMRW